MDLMQQLREQRARNWHAARGVLTRARILLEHPYAWAHDALARDSRGRVVAPDDPSARGWSVLGALGAPTVVAGARGDMVAMCYAIDALARSLPPAWRVNNDWEGAVAALTAYNDTLGTIHDDILALLDRATELLDRQLGLVR
jgi:hypothetical protein